MTPSSPQEVAVLIPLVLALLTTLITIGVHAVALGAIVQLYGANTNSDALAPDSGPTLPSWPALHCSP